MIPYGVINGAEAIEMDSETIRYDENYEYKTKGRLIIYDNIRFKEKINEKFKKNVQNPGEW